jgi:hypothetical protein
LALKSRQSLRNVFLYVVRSEFIIIAGWIILFYVFYILKNVTILSRYSLIVLPLLILVTMLLLAKVCTRLSLSRRDTHGILIGLTVLSLVFHGLFTLFVVKPDADSFVRGFQNEYRNIASIISAEHYRDGGVMVSEVGMIGVYSGLKVYDFVGLVDKERHLFSTKRGYFLSKRPQYLISRGEVVVEELVDSSTSFQEIYKTKIAGFGINQRDSATISVFRVSYDTLRSY